MSFFCDGPLFSYDYHSKYVDNYQWKITRGKRNENLAPFTSVDLELQNSYFRLQALKSRDEFKTQKLKNNIEISMIQN